VQEVWATAVRFGHGILRNEVDGGEVHRKVMEALARIEDSSFSSIGDIVVYETDYGERGVLPFTIGSAGWFEFARDLEAIEEHLSTIAQIHDLMWGTA
jgi:hypothetical protein